MAKQPTNQFLKFVLWAAGVCAGLFILLLIVAAILIPILLPPAKLKAMAMNELTTALKHKVTIGDVHFNVFSGFDIQDLVVANRVGWADRPMVSAEDISISYHLLPLLWGKVSLGEIKLNQPQIFVERRNPSQFNFSDMTGDSSPPVAPAPAPTPKAVAKSGKKSPLKKKRKKNAELQAPEKAVSSSFFADTAWADSAHTTSPGQAGSTQGNTAASNAGKTSGLPDISVDSLNIEGADLEYLDETASPAQKATAPDLNLKISNISLNGGKISFSLDTPFTYNKLSYKLALGGSARYFFEGQSIKGLDLKGTVNDLGFNLSGDALNMTGDLTPTMDGQASLDMLKFAGLVPSNLSKMPEGLSLGGPAKVDFHLAGSKSKGLELSGTADGSELAIQYKDLFVKTAKTACTVDFKSVNKMNEGIYDVPSFKVVYADWTVTGSFHYAGSNWSCKIHSDSLPFKGLPGMLPKLKNTTIDGGGSVDLSIAPATGKGLPFLVNGQVALKGVGITLPNEPYLQSMNGTIYCSNDVIRIPPITFNAFDGTGALSVTFNGATSACSYAFSLKNVNAQKAVDASIDAYVTTKDYTSYKDKLYGTMNFAYSGSGRVTSGDQMMASQVGSGNYSLVDAKIKGLAALQTINSYLKDKSDEINFDKIDGTLAMKNKLFSFTLNSVGKVGAIHETGGIEMVKMAYSPDMEVRCDIRQDSIDFAAVSSGIPSVFTGFVKNTSCLADANGNVPIDLKFTGPVSENHYSWDPGRMVNNIKKNEGAQIQNTAQPVIKNLGNQLKSLFH